MRRTQISLEGAQYRRLVDEARKAGVSMSALIRRLLAEHFDEQPGAPSEDALESIVGIGRGTGEAVGRDHDAYLYARHGSAWQTRRTQEMRGSQSGTRVRRND